MAKYISPQEFVNITKGKAYDVDGYPKKQPYQCVDGIAEFCVLVYGEHNFTCGNGWAYGLWTCYGTNGVEKYFNQHPFSEAKEGDWVIWNKGSKDAPTSHVAMYSKKIDNTHIEAYGQNQNGKKYFNFANVSTNGILGVLRPKIYETGIQYRVYVQDDGWTKWVSSGIAGTTGKNKVIRAVEFKSDKEITANAHINNIGWKDYGKVNDGKQVGESSHQLECLQLKGDFKYRVHISYFGWTNWTTADGICTLGSVGMHKGIEAIEIG